jgi:hypothetical protein
MSLEFEHPSIDFHCPATEAHVSLGFGYLHNEPMMPIFKGDELILMMPREVLVAALKEGWGGTETGWWVDPGIN